MQPHRDSSASGDGQDGHRRSKRVRNHRPSQRKHHRRRHKEHKPGEDEKPRRRSRDSHRPHRENDHHQSNLSRDQEEQVFHPPPPQPMPLPTPHRVSLPRPIDPFWHYPQEPFVIAHKHRFDLYSCLQPTGIVLGYGAFAVVIQVQDTRFPEERLLAVKQNYNAFQTVADGRKLLRELLILQHFTAHPHDSLMNLVGVIVPPVEKRDSFDSICLIMNQHPSSLKRVIDTQIELSPDHISRIFYQILSGVRALHDAGIIHRDLKPDNVLIDSKCGIKVIDYNMSREIPAEDDGVLVSDVVVARWYRAPEVVFTRGGYGEKIDLWSVGCILAEVYYGKPFFKEAETAFDLVCQQMQLLGAPQGDRSWINRVEESGFSYREYVDAHASEFEPQDMSVIFSKASPEAVNLLGRLLTLHPNDRASADEAMNLPLFGGEKKKKRKTRRRFALPANVQEVMYGTATIPELRSAMYDVLSTFNQKCMQRKLAKKARSEERQRTRRTSAMKPPPTSA